MSIKDKDKDIHTPHFKYCFYAEPPNLKTVPYFTPILPSKEELKLDFVNTLKENSEKMNESVSTQVILLFDSINHHDYVLKRAIYPFHYESGKNNKYQITKVESHITTYFNEFRMMNYYSKSKFGVKPIGFKPFYLYFYNYVITETLMEYGSETFPSLNLNNKYDQLLKITMELIKAIRSLEKFKILHNDIKVYNILLQMKSSDRFNLKIIDFDVALFIESMTKEEICKASRGFSDGYVSPEKLLFLDNINNDDSLIDHKKFYDFWKSQIYSLGVTILINIGYFDPKGTLFKHFDNFKRSANEYNNTFWANFIDYYERVDEEKDFSKKALLFLAKCSLDYKEKTRFSSFELKKIVQKNKL